MRATESTNLRSCRGPESAESAESAESYVTEETMNRNVRTPPRKHLFAWMLLIPLGISPSQAAEIVVSSGAINLPDAIRAIEIDSPLALRIDSVSLDPDSTEQILHAIDDRRRANGVTVAVCSNASDGAAVIALACDALVTLPGGTLEGASALWSKSPSQLDALAEDLARLGQLDPKLARRIVGVRGSLSWSTSVGFVDAGDEQFRLATPGRPAALKNEFLLASGLVSREFDTATKAVSAIESGEVVARVSGVVLAADVGSAETSEMPVFDWGTPPPPPPPPPPSLNLPSPPSKSPPTPNAPRASTPAAAPSAPNTPAPVNPKLATFVANYRKALVELQVDLREFDRYYEGEIGTWIGGINSLREAWDRKIQVPHINTRTRGADLQRDIRSAIASLKALAKSITKIAADPTNREVVWVNSHTDAFNELYEAIQKDNTQGYERFAPVVSKLK